MAAPTNAYIIHIPGDPRRERNVASLMAVLREAGIANVEVMPGVQPPDKGPMFSIGEWGCYLSHLECLRRAAARPADESTFILEDDALLDVPVAELVATFERAASRDWDFLHLGYGGNTVFRDWDEQVLSADFLRVRGVLFTTLGYCVRSPGLADRIDFLERHAVSSPLDGGGVGIDGAYCEMTWADPTLVRLAPPRSLFRPVPGIKSMLRPNSALTRASDFVGSSLANARERVRKLVRRG